MSVERQRRFVARKHMKQQQYEEVARIFIDKEINVQHTSKIASLNVICVVIKA